MSGSTTYNANLTDANFKIPDTREGEAQVLAMLDRRQEERLKAAGGDATKVKPKRRKDKKKDKVSTGTATESKSWANFDC